jgi:hypothetical protein
VTAAFGKLAYKAAGDWANARQQEEQARCGAGNACPEADRWGESGAYKIALHTVIGGMAFGSAGALSSATVETTGRYIHDTLVRRDQPGGVEVRRSDRAPRSRYRVGGSELGGGDLVGQQVQGAWGDVGAVADVYESSDARQRARRSTALGSRVEPPVASGEATSGDGSARRKLHHQHGRLRGAKELRSGKVLQWRQVLAVE